MLEEKLKQLLEEKKDLVKQARQLIQEIEKDKESGDGEGDDDSFDQY